MTDRSLRLVREARRRLGIDRLALSIHDASFPAGSDDIGRGTPCSDSGLAWIRFAGELGFDVLQLGPQGETSREDPSPYSGAAFSRDTLSISAATLRNPDEGSLLTDEDLARALADRPETSLERADHAFAWNAQQELLARAHRRLRASSGRAAAAMRERDAAFARHHADWLTRDGLYHALALEHAGRGHREWPDPDRRLLHPRPNERERCERRRRQIETSQREILDFHRFTQRIAYEQHERLRVRLHREGIQVYGDLQIGLADRDVWALDPLLIPGYRLGAPPSRTNPDGQPWGYPVFDPDRFEQAGADGPVVEHIRTRLELAFEIYDGLRIDHPHGLVCPWVYRAADPDPELAVRTGGRLFSTAGLPGHEALYPYDIPRPDQIDRDRRPWDDRWVRTLDPEQVDRYAILFDAIVGAARHAGRGPEALVCEVLSTLPHPLARVLERYGLGRFRVTSKIDPARADDPYRIEACNPPDWVMIGNHDTPPVWALLEGWDPSHRVERARYAATLLEPDSARRAELAGLLVEHPGLLAQAMLAELFVARARNVMIFFADLLGLTESYNCPGTVSPENWSLRVPPEFRSFHRDRLAHHRALNIPLALALALRAEADPPRDLVRSLFEEARRHGPVPEAWTAP